MKDCFLCHKPGETKVQVYTLCSSCRHRFWDSFPGEIALFNGDHPGFGWTNPEKPSEYDVAWFKQEMQERFAAGQAITIMPDLSDWGWKKGGDDV